MFLPFGHDHRYDMIVDTGEKLVRVQIKTARAGTSEGSIQLKAESVVDRIGGKVRTIYSTAGGDVLLFHHPQLDKVFVAKPTGWSCLHLRYDATRNGQKARIRHAADYELRHLEQLL